MSGGRGVIILYKLRVSTMASHFSVGIPVTSECDAVTFPDANTATWSELE